MEVCYFLSTRATPAAEAAFLRSVAVGSFSLIALTSEDLERCAQLVERYADLPLGAADASIVAVAERLRVRQVPDPRPHPLLDRPTSPRRRLRVAPVAPPVTGVGNGLGDEPQLASDANEVGARDDATEVAGSGPGRRCSEPS
jgi:hypothetical protein